MRNPPSPSLSLSLSLSLVFSQLLSNCLAALATGTVVLATSPILFLRSNYCKTHTNNKLYEMSEEVQELKLN